ncbi:MAG: NusA antitermination factor, utilization substance protein [Candidatus Doudnabacteria bacterium]|nr:NusA antitermination factor, utilization substance protein [Candidatus Doudnabacteria bacterium]
MNEAFEQALDQIEDEKGIPREEIIGMIEASLAAAFRKDYGEKDQNIVVEFNAEDLATKVYDLKTVVAEITDPQKEIALEDAKEIDSKYKVGDEIKNEITPKDGTTFGRIAAQTAKQVIIQKLREAERNVMFSDYKSKERTLVNGTVQRVEGDTILVDLGKATGVLFPSEQIRGEKYEPNQRLKVLILHVEPAAKGPKITLSRSHPDMVRKLFELEVPEIFSGTVEIKSIAREAGSRTKIAVYSAQEGIDPIGACVGQRGTRVQTVMAEIGGEKIDIIEWSDNAVKFIANSLSPAKILNVQLDMEEKSAKVGVLEDQLSLAIGKAGQNVRLAARLTGWKIDINGEKITSDEEPAPEADSEVTTPTETNAEASAEQGE